jgi:hypothetical protein
VQQIGEGDVIHDEVALFLVHLQEEGLVFDDVFVVEMLDIREISLQEEDVLPVQAD